MTQRQLALTAQVDIKTIYNLESGERWPQAATRAKIEKALGWVVGSLEALADGQEAARQFPTRAELIDEGLRRSRLTPGEVISRAEITDREWQRLSTGSATLTDARHEDRDLAVALSRVAIHLGLTPQQLTDAGQELAAANLQRLIAATDAPADRVTPPDVQLARLLELWPRLKERQRKAIVTMVEDILGLDETVEPTGKPEEVVERRTG